MILQERQRRLILQESLTNSKRASHYIEGVYPTHISKAKGCYVWDEDGNQYTDYVMGLGTQLMGYAHDEIVNAVHEQHKKGSIYSVASRLETEVAKKLSDMFPFISKWRFLKTGSEACLAAVRIARSITGRKDIHSRGYHGWGDIFTSLTPPKHGVRDLHYINTESMDPVAGYICEPVELDASFEYQKKLMFDVKNWRELGTLVIFDEIITGMRFPEGGVCNNFKIKPDILLLGKALGGGLPLSALGVHHKLEAESNEWFVSSTFAGDTLALAACSKMLDMFHKEHPLDYLWHKGGAFRDAFNKLDPEIQIVGYNTRGMLDTSKRMVQLFMQEACKAGLLFGKAWFYSFSHPQCDERVLNICSDIIRKINFSDVRLEGKPVRESFARYQ